MDVALPPPLVPAEVDLAGYGYMPLQGHRLFGSEFNAHAPDSAWRAAVTLWWAAWNQVPAASLPDDDVALARLADLGRDVRTWRKMRDLALHGFVKCSDGRLYHRVLSELAIDAWDRRVEWREVRDAKAERQRRWREQVREMSETLRARGITPPQGASLKTLREMVEASTPRRTVDASGDGSEMPKKGSEGKGSDSSVPNGTGGKAATNSAKALDLNDTEAVKAAAYEVAGRIKRRSAPTELMKAGMSWPEIYAALVTAATKADPQSYIASRINQSGVGGNRVPTKPANYDRLLVGLDDDQATTNQGELR